MAITKIGTSHFQNIMAANAYYATYEYSAADVQAKLVAGEIHLGKPAYDGDDRFIGAAADSEGRYIAFFVDGHITRAEYMANYSGALTLDRELGAALHNHYYRQFVTPAIVSFVERCIGKAAILKSEDPHFNDITLSKWDAMEAAIRQSVDGSLWRNLSGSGSMSRSDTVCIAKQAARIIKARG